MNRLAVVTGASSGIGRATALRLVEEGWRVIAIARRAAVLNELAASAGPELIPMACDGGNGDAVLEIALAVQSKFGVPDLVINNAGAGQWKEIENTAPDELNHMLDAPFRSAFHVTHAFIAAMLERGSGRILHVNSPACIMPWGGCTGYAAVRFALRGLNEALNADLTGTGVSSCNVIFGEVDSPYFEANPDSKHKMPGVAAVIPMMSADACANILCRLSHGQQREVVAPFMLRTFVWCYHLCPGFVRWLIKCTQRKRSA